MYIYIYMYTHTHHMYIYIYIYIWRAFVKLHDSHLEVLVHLHQLADELRLRRELDLIILYCIIIYYVISYHIISYHIIV